jgi:hypothetical protein
MDVHAFRRSLANRSDADEMATRNSFLLPTAIDILFL